MPGKELNPITVARGVKCDVASPGDYVVRNKRDWAKVYQMVRGHGRNPDDDGMNYDFSNITILAVYLGSNGSAIKISKVEESEKSLEVLVLRNTSNAKAGLTPYHIVRIPSSTKEIVFKYEDDLSLRVSDVTPYS